MQIQIVNFEDLKKYLETERKAFIKVHAFNEDDQDFIRPVEAAEKVLAVLGKIQTNLAISLQEHPSIITLFDSEFGPFFDFLKRERILELCFMDDFLFPEEESFPFAEEGKLNEELLTSYIGTFDDWATVKKSLHDETRSILLEKFTLDLAQKDLACQCVNCLGDYRTQIRETAYKDGKAAIESGKTIILQEINRGPDIVSDHFYNVQKEVEKISRKVFHRLKKSSQQRLETQLKDELKEVFAYPSPLAVEYSNTLIPYFQKLLKEQNLRSDLIGDEEYQKFFRQLITNLWRNEKYLEREFKKLTNAVLLFKRKDISAKILIEYLGQFWLHSRARGIKRKIIYHLGPTNSGKTYHAIEALCKARKGCYLAPLRLLAAELYDTMNNKGVPTTLLTGEEIVETEGANHVSSTIEMARFNEDFDCAVIDEIQMMSDTQRGWAWTRALVNICAPEVHICGDRTVLDLVKQIVELTGDVLEIISYERMTELKVEEMTTGLGGLKKGDALIVFSRRNALNYKRDLEQMGFKVSIVYGMLSPEVRREQARKFDKGETDIIVSTDAIAMGMNLPIRRIVFSTLSKYIDQKEYRISQSEIKQISGRAGRYGRFPIGFVSCLNRERDGIRDIREAMHVELAQKKESMVGPDLDIFTKVNHALINNGLPVLKLSEFLRLFNTMTFKKPFFCVDLREMIEIAEMVEDADHEGKLTASEAFGFTCAPVNLNLVDHVQYFVWMLNNFVNARPIKNEEINEQSTDIDYLETSIKCVELYQWLSRHFANKFFDYNLDALLFNKGKAIEKLNNLLSEKMVKSCMSCGCQLPENYRFNICDNCFSERREARYKRDDGERKAGAGPSGPPRFRRNKGHSPTTSKRSGPPRFHRSKKSQR